ncbi:MAG: RNA-binding transcriptional accessory protein [Chloroflexi bacterium GWB2_49_20]|nr:MAG: RNA-binding transcriptional accessory protein [Chloroflexi bacterium GWB2_49_20]OGN80040.1 MAG: RNA-binding transcriptional accessory protein [Chloroflexi bacterium GWC2_49_37]OGN85424.1 MAG: RNA-binding transcriptional accessory protein [Chloroflexi bacterium GWD2_49_16]HBG74284.1 RNA-binding transcriptional accessory protein [Anaerolineae bacterium]HCM97106.1 RNA-binding transcriptional accessory protein [Anaerolineae bacterium]
MSIAETIASKLNLQLKQVIATIELFDEGNTLPFIARYRKEATGELDEEQIRQISTWLEKLRTLEERRVTILTSIEEQGKLSVELRLKIMAAESMTILEDLYTPYKPKRRTRAMIAREKGLEGLADVILKQPRGDRLAETIAVGYLNDQVNTVEEALSGARDIVAEIISESAAVRQLVREKALKWATLLVEKNESVSDEKAVFQSYYGFENRVDRLQAHQILAINRGEKENVLNVKVIVPERDWRTVIEDEYPANLLSPMVDQLAMAIEDSASRLLLPAIERDVRRELSEHANGHAIQVFSTNLKALLSQPPLAGKVVLGIDPGFRTGSKLAVVDSTGKLLDTATIYPHAPQNKWDASLKTLQEIIDRHNVNLITIGNGTASRETEKLVAELTRNTEMVKYLIVSEAGASVYSASPLARGEMPDLDVSLRGAVSIARRAQDPMAELVKIDPKSIGIGLYQHDVDQMQLISALNGVVESVVNSVGVDLNTASPALLTFVSGVGPKLANKIVAYRDSAGTFLTRIELRKVPGLGPKAFEQAAGFLRVREGKNPLDASAIHPESYNIAENILNMAGLTSKSTPAERKNALDKILANKTHKDLANELNCGLPTLNDILEQLVRPGRDPRTDTPTPILRIDVLSVEDLSSGMILKGTVRNVVDFGAFVDIGVKQDGLLHRSQIPTGAVLRVGAIIEVTIQKIEPERGRIGLGWVSKLEKANTLQEKLINKDSCV